MQLSETYERALSKTSPWSKRDVNEVEPPIELRLSPQLREKVASLGGLRGSARENPVHLATAINLLIEKF